MDQVGDVSEKSFSLDKVEGTVKLTKMVEIPPFCTIQVHGTMKVKDHDKSVYFIVEPKNNGYNPSVVAVPSYAYLKPGSSKVNIMVKAKSIVPQLAAANVVLSMSASKNPQGSEMGTQVKWGKKNMVP